MIRYVRNLWSLTASFNRTILVFSFPMLQPRYESDKYRTLPFGLIDSSDPSQVMCRYYHSILQKLLPWNGLCYHFFIGISAGKNRMVFHAFTGTFSSVYTSQSTPVNRVVTPKKGNIRAQTGLNVFSGVLYNYISKGFLIGKQS